MFRSQLRAATVSEKRLLSNLSERLHVFLVKKTTWKRIRKRWKLMVTFYIWELYSWSQSWFSSFKKRSLFFFSYAFTRSFLLKTCVNAQKDWKAGVFRSQSGTAIVSETRTVFLDFTYFSVRLNALLKIFVCLGKSYRVKILLDS